MKKISSYVVLVLILYSCQCKEKNKVEHSLPIAMEEYFGMYKLGKYWVYANKDNSFRDSAYVKDFETTYYVSEGDCDFYEARFFFLKGLTRACNGNLGNRIEYYDGGIVTLNTPACVFNIDYDNQNNKINVRDTTLFYLPSITLNNKKYYNILASYRYNYLLNKAIAKSFYSKGIGLIGYWSEDYNDTMNLVKRN